MNRLEESCQAAGYAAKVIRGLIPQIYALAMFDKPQ